MNRKEDNQLVKRSNEDRLLDRKRGCGRPGMRRMNRQWLYIFRGANEKANRIYIPKIMDNNKN